MNINHKVTILMYHYVRDLTYSRYPDIKGLDMQLFREQIKYLKKHYHFITMEMLMDAIDHNHSLPEKSVLLTFDDAYIDHYTHVFPLLDEYKIQGSFYPPAKSITEHSVLDVNKIHFILAAEPDRKKIINEIYNQLNIYREAYQLQSNAYYFDKLAEASRLDDAAVIFIKRILQVALDESLRNKITNHLFQLIVGASEESFSRELYMNIDQLKCMHRNGMHIGNHGYDHYWLGSLSQENQKIEIEKSLHFLKEIGCDTKQWTMCYPYGNYNKDTLAILHEKNCKLALTTEVAIADIQQYNKYTLPRLDTNDIPKDQHAETNQWYLTG